MALHHGAGRLLGRPGRAQAGGGVPQRRRAEGRRRHPADQQVQQGHGQARRLRGRGLGALRGLLRARRGLRDGGGVQAARPHPGARAGALRAGPAHQRPRGGRGRPPRGLGPRHGRGRRARVQAPPRLPHRPRQPQLPRAAARLAAGAGLPHRELRARGARGRGGARGLRPARPRGHRAAPGERQEQREEVRGRRGGRRVGRPAARVLPVLRGGHGPLGGTAHAAAEPPARRHPRTGPGRRARRRARGRRPGARAPALRRRPGHAQVPRAHGPRAPRGAYVRRVGLLGDRGARARLARRRGVGARSVPRRRQGLRGHGLPHVRRAHRPGRQGAAAARQGGHARPRLPGRPQGARAHGGPQDGHPRGGAAEDGAHVAQRQQAHQAALGRGRAGSVRGSLGRGPAEVRARRREGQARPVDRRPGDRPGQRAQPALPQGARGSGRREP